jgi:hypothetical protein
MSLRWRILGAFILTIVFTIWLSTGVEYWTEGRHLDKFSTKIRTGDLAGGASRIYAANKSWHKLEPTLSRYGFLIDPAKIREAEEAGIDPSCFCYHVKGLGGVCTHPPLAVLGGPAVGKRRLSELLSEHQPLCCAVKMTMLH